MLRFKKSGFCESDMNAIDAINKKALAYNEAVSPALREIVAPLFDYLDINHFGYSRLHDGNRYMIMCLDSSWTNKYFTHDLDDQLLFEDLAMPKHTMKTVIWDLQPENSMLRSLREHGFHHGISIYYRHETFIEGWHFGTKPDNPQINNLYTQNLNYLEDFIIYFQEKAHDLISGTDKDRLAMYKNNRYLCLSAMDLAIKNLDKEGFLAAVQPYKYLFPTSQGTVSLSQTEFECLKGIAEGMSAKVIALEKQLSPRTVETVLERVKTKFDMNSKVRLIQEYKKSIYWHMRPS
jgi:DNA-binding CsgD family transcriptional regulator